LLVYVADKRQFMEHVRSSEIDDRIILAMQDKGLGKVSAAEIASWRNSMKYMMAVLMDEGIPDDTGVAIEYKIPQTSKRIDFILTGKNADDRSTAIIVELKQWSEVAATAKDGIVETFVGGGQREMLHPSYQAWSYAALLEDFNEAIESNQICAYLHNCTSDSIHSSLYKSHIDKAPAFLKRDAAKLTRFIQQHVRKGDRDEILYRIENGRIRPSKSLADHMVSLLEGNREFLMIDDQKLVYESALYLSELAQTEGKQVMLVEGGPGTGKSVLAVNLLVELISRGRLSHYVTRNSAPREVYRSKLTGSMTKTRIDNIFKSSGSYHAAESDSFDALIVDEAHRVNERSGMFSNLGENQVKEIIEAAKLSIFFLDEDQRVTWKDIGSREEVERWANWAGANIHYATLRSQFRCNGSDGYLAWLDQALQIRDTANTDPSELDYSIRVVDSPIELRDRIFEHNIESNRARLLAGYCWNWVSKKDPELRDIEFPAYNFSMRWNLDKDGMLWLLQPNSVHEIGCIHTCQGLELDYAGVIIGPDLIVRNGRIIAQPEERSKNDSSIKGTAVP
jgi:DNA replication protein DnaC